MARSLAYQRTALEVLALSKAAAQELQQSVEDLSATLRCMLCL